MSSAQAAPVIRASLEPEIQYKVPLKLLPRIERVLQVGGGRITSRVQDEKTTYLDTKHNRYIREGIEVRSRRDGHNFRIDMKTPRDRGSNIVLPDEDGILWRHELKAKLRERPDTLSVFFGQRILNPVQARVKDLFEKILEPKFHGIYDKTKIERQVSAGQKTGAIEYSLQRGRLENISGTRVTPTHGIVDLEWRGGPEAVPEEVLREAKHELERVFGDEGLAVLPERKVLMGFRLVEPELRGEAYDKLHRLLEEYKYAPAGLAMA